jgi:hypothetical protein
MKIDWRTDGLPYPHQRGLLASPHHRAAFFFTHSALDQEKIWGVFIGYLLAPGLKASSPILTALSTAIASLARTIVQAFQMTFRLRLYKCSNVPRFLAAPIFPPKESL